MERCELVCPGTHLAADAYGQPNILDPDYSPDADQIPDYDNYYLFTGRRVDILDSGSFKIQYNRNRYYDYYTGRWTTQDPVRAVPAYEYASQEPVDKVDAYGLEDRLVIGYNPIADPISDPVDLVPIYSPPIIPAPEPETCGYKVDCGNLYVDNCKEWSADKCKAYHCDLNRTSVPNLRENARVFSVWVDKTASCDRKIMMGKSKGKPCKCATCEDIHSCVDAAWHEFHREPAVPFNNCHTWAARQMTHCCLNTTWKPAWFAGDATCVEWEVRRTGFIRGEPAYANVCVKRIRITYPGWFGEFGQ